MSQQKTFTVFCGLGPNGDVTEELFHKKLEETGPYIKFTIHKRRHAWIHCRTFKEAELFVSKLDGTYIKTSKLMLSHAREDQQNRGGRIQSEIVNNWDVPTNSATATTASSSSDNHHIQYHHQGGSSYKSSNSSYETRNFQQQQNRRKFNNTDQEAPPSRISGKIHSRTEDKQTTDESMMPRPKRSDEDKSNSSAKKDKVLRRS